ncbi:uncharacterized protein [Onthophagus taurus]|uniref:uncharacterized protein n=1 Tax=Onthophagus taurus TaxID=166361 RepID=UPI0039BE16D4
MVFGEIIIPSSRSLYGDDFHDVEPYTPNPFRWDDDSTLNLSKIKIDVLIIINTKSIIEVFKQCVYENLRPFKVSTEQGLSLYNLNINTYLLVCENKPNYSSGEIFLNIMDIVGKSTKIYGVTSSALTMFEGDQPLQEESCTIFTLKTPQINDTFFYEKLPIPNFITGICADLLTYSLCNNKSCAVFIGFLDTASLDSKNTLNLIQLMRQIGIQGVKGFSLKIRTPENNLYA